MANVTLLLSEEDIRKCIGMEDILPTIDEWKLICKMVKKAS